MWQGHEPWGAVLHGYGPHTIGQWGCGLVCETLAKRWFGIDPKALPHEVQAIALKADPTAFDGDLCDFPRVAHANGMHCGDRVEGVVSMQTAIAEALRDGGLVMLHVDKTADGKGDHWVLAVQLENNSLLYLDPATAQTNALSFATLHGKTLWDGVPKQYQCVGVRVLTKA